jgi:hypothetical protein
MKFAVLFLFSLLSTQSWSACNMYFLTAHAVERTEENFTEKDLIDTYVEIREELLAKSYLNDKEIIVAQKIYRGLSKYQVTENLKSLNFLIGKSLKKNLRGTVKTTNGVDQEGISTVFISRKGKSKVNTFTRKLEKYYGVKDVTYDIETLARSHSLGMYSPATRQLHLSDKAATGNTITDIEVHESIHAYFTALRNDSKLLTSRGLNSGRGAVWHNYVTAEEGIISTFKSDYPNYQSFEEGYTHTVANLNAYLRRILDKGIIEAKDKSDIIYLLKRVKNFGYQQMYASNEVEKVWDGLYRTKSFKSTDKFGFYAVPGAQETGINIEAEYMVANKKTKITLTMPFVTDEEKQLGAHYNNILTHREGDVVEADDEKFYRYIKSKLKDNVDTSTKLSDLSVKTEKDFRELVKEIGLKKKLSDEDKNKLIDILRAPGAFAKKDNQTVRPLVDPAH